MGTDDPELRARRLAALRAAYEAGTSQADEWAGGGTRHARALLGRILALLGESKKPADPRR